MKTSARNQFRGKVKAIRRGTVNADVVLDLGDGVEICANITNEAIDELGLKRGRDAVALIKASFVVLAIGDDIQVSAGNRLSGTVDSIVKGPVNSEVKVQLGATRTLVAVISSAGLKTLKLRKGSACCALINASHVLIAVND
jgi:molybdate transport system regulatory protein